MESNRMLLIGALTATILAAGVLQAKDWDDTGHKLHGDRPHCHHHDDGTGALLHLLPEEKRKLLHEGMENVHKQNAGLFEQKHKLHEELNAILTAPEFDRQAYLAKEAQLDAIHEKMKKNAEKAFADVAAKFTPEERKILAELQHLRHHHHDHGFHHTHDGAGHEDKVKSEHQPSE